MDLVVAHELSIHGSHGMAAHEYPAMLALIADGTLHPERLIGQVIDLAAGPAALMAMDTPAPTAGLTVIDLSR